MKRNSLNPDLHPGLIWLFLLLPVFAASCTNPIVIPEATPSSNAPRTEVQPGHFPTGFAQEVQATSTARAAASIRLTEAWATQSAEQETADQSSTSEAHLQETARARPMFERIAELRDSALLGATEGNYFAIPNFETSWAQKDFYDFTLTEQAPSNFVVNAAVAWETAFEPATWSNSGCGFTYRMNARGDHYLAFLAMDGWAYLYRNLNGSILRLGRGRYNNATIPRGNAEVTLVVEGERTTLLVDNHQVFQLSDQKLSSGFLGLAIVSGSNYDFGTRCWITAIELWELEVE